MTLKKQYQKALEERRIVIVGVKYTKAGWTGFRVYEIHKNTLVPVIEEKASYWKDKKHFYECRAWGTDHRLEVILSIGYTLGLKFNEIRQNYQWLQDTY